MSPGWSSFWSHFWRKIIIIMAQIRAGRCDENIFSINSFLVFDSRPIHQNINILSPNCPASTLTTSDAVTNVSVSSAFDARKREHLFLFFFPAPSKNQPPINHEMVPCRLACLLFVLIHQTTSSQGDPRVQVQEGDAILTFSEPS